MAAALAFGSLEEKKKNAVRASCFAGELLEFSSLMRKVVGLKR